MNEQPNLLTSSCPSCHRTVSDVFSVTPGETPSDGDGYVCPCGALCIFTIDGLRQMTEEEATALSEDERRDIDFATRNISCGGTEE